MEKIEIQTRYSAQLYNVDIRNDQCYLAEHDLFPCGESEESRFSPDFAVPLTRLEVEVKAVGAGGASLRPGTEISSIQICRDRTRSLNGPERTVIADLMELISSYNPDLILFPYADS